MKVILFKWDAILSILTVSFGQGILVNDDKKWDAILSILTVSFGQGILVNDDKKWDTNKICI